MKRHISKSLPAGVLTAFGSFPVADLDKQRPPEGEYRFKCDQSISV